MAADDTQMVSAVRKIVISNWFDISQIRVRVTRGVVNLQGHVEKVAGEKATPSQMATSLQKMDDAFRSIKGFRGAAYLFDNWVREGTGAWRFSGTRGELERLDER